MGMTETGRRGVRIEHETLCSIESAPRSRGTSQERNTSSILVKSGLDTSRISVPTATLRASWKFLSGRRGRGLSWGRGGGGGIIHQARIKKTPRWGIVEGLYQMLSNIL